MTAKTDAEAIAKFEQPQAGAIAPDPAGWTAFEFHPYCAQLPEMRRPEFEALKASIAERGLQSRIVLYQGKILDGRHRYKALLELVGEDPCPIPLNLDQIFVEFPGSDANARAIVEVTNRKRQCLSCSQLACEALCEIEARKVPISEEAAAAKGSHCQSVLLAKAVRDRSPELFEIVRAGGMTLNAAKKRCAGETECDEERREALVKLPLDSPEEGATRLAGKLPPDYLKAIAAVLAARFES